MNFSLGRNRLGQSFACQSVSGKPSGVTSPSLIRAMLWKIASESLFLMSVISAKSVRSLWLLRSGRVSSGVAEMVCCGSKPVVRRKVEIAAVSLRCNIVSVNL